MFYIGRKELALFRRRAIRRYPKEYIEGIWGKIVGRDTYVCALEPVPHIATRDNVWYPTGEEPEMGMRIGKVQLIGTIHTHPDEVCSPSEDDIVGSVEDGERIMGIVSINRRGRRRIMETKFFRQTGHEIKDVQYC